MKAVKVILVAIVILISLFYGMLFLTRDDDTALGGLVTTKRVTTTCVVH